MLINVTVIVMRESRIEYYDPAYRSPFYPWTQRLGILASVVLISYLGHLAISMTIIGEPPSINQLYHTYIADESSQP